MKLIRCHVYNFGGLCDFQYDFSEGLNTFLQDNGWGKTTLATFLKVMFYGFAEKSCYEDSEKKRFTPWGEGTFGGELDFSVDNKMYKITRIFYADEKEDTINVTDLSDGKEVHKFGKNIGESIFKIDVNAFARSVFIGQNGLTNKKAASSLNERLKTLVSQISDLFMYDSTINKLSQKLSSYVKEDGSGVIDGIMHKIALKKEILDIVENEIKSIDASKERMIELDKLIVSSAKEIEEKKEDYEKFLVRYQKNEAIKKQIVSIYAKKTEIENEMDILRGHLGDNIPINSEVENFKKDSQNEELIFTQLEDLKNAYSSAIKELDAITNRYLGKIPSMEQVDTMQNLYSEIQGIKLSNEEDFEEPSKDYLLIKEALKDDPKYVDKLIDLMFSQSEIQQYIQEIEKNDFNIRHENEIWNDRKKSYNDMKNDVELLSNRIKNNDFVKRLDRPKYPTEKECMDVLDRVKEIEKKKANLSFMSLRLESDQSEMDNLSDSLLELKDEPSMKLVPVNKPKKAHSTAIISGGLGACAASIGLGFVVNPSVSYALAAAGVVIVFGGLNGRRKYRIKSKEYDNYIDALSLKRAYEDKKDGVKNKQDRLTTSINISKKMIDNLNEDIEKDVTYVSEFSRKWNNGEEITPSVIDSLIDKIKKDELEQKTIIESSNDETNIFTEEDFNMAKSQLNMANKNVEKFLSGYGLSEDDLQRKDSSRAVELKTSANMLLKKLDDKMRDCNTIIAKLSLYMVKDNYMDVFSRIRQMLNSYERYSDRLKEREERVNKRRAAIEELNEKLSESILAINDAYSEEDFVSRLSLVREDINNAKLYNEKTKEMESKNVELMNKYDIVKEKINSFRMKYCNVFQVSDNDYTQFFNEVEKYNEDMHYKMEYANEITSLKEQLDTQKEILTYDNLEKLKEDIDSLEKLKDEYMIEYTKKGEFVLQADKSIEVYPDICIELKELDDKLKTARINSTALNNTIEILKKAKDNLYFRYLSSISNKLNEYLGVALNNSSLKGVLDVDFNIRVEEDGVTHMADDYSTGYCDLIDFCMRLALVDTLFENETPFVILDDPFANLDVSHLEKAKELLNIFAHDKQIIYFVCHDTRAISDVTKSDVQKSAS